MAEDSVIKCLQLSESSSSSSSSSSLSKIFRELMEKENNIITTKRLEGDNNDDNNKPRVSLFTTVANIFRGSPKKDEERMLTVDDFELLKVVGKGAFGKVMLVRKKDTSTG